MKNSEITQKIEELLTKEQCLKTSVIDANIFALIKYKKSKTTRNYAPPEWAIGYEGLVDVVYAYPKDKTAKLVVKLRSIKAPSDDYFAPYAKEILRILTLEEAQNEFPEYLI